MISNQKLPTQKKPRTKCLHCEFCETFTEESMLHFSNQIWREAITPKLIEKPITLIPKSEKDTTRKENYRPLYLINIDAKTLNKILANEIEQYLKRIITTTKRDLSLGYKSKNVIQHINRMKVFFLNMQLSHRDRKSIWQNTTYFHD